MGFRDLLKKKEAIEANVQSVHTASERPALPNASEFTFVRTDTHTEEIIKPPHYEGDEDSEKETTTTPTKAAETSKPRKSFGSFRKKSGTTTTVVESPEKEKRESKEHKRLTEKLHLNLRDQASSTSSVNLPADLPDIKNAYDGKGDRTEKEAQWEDRATKLISANPLTQTQNVVPTQTVVADISKKNIGGSHSDTGPSGRPRSVSDADSDVNIQNAIKLHEEGKLEEATSMFHKLADQGNVLSQVLYGLSLRHGWGCKPNLEQAVKYLTSAASNSAAIEAQALKAGLKKGGAAKGELVLAIFELGNCFRYGWGVKIDKVAARQYYETAANLGDTDAMNEAAWCYLEGFGGKKDKFKAAQLLRLAEKNGSKTLGNTWIWKEKYDPK